MILINKGEEMKKGDKVRLKKGKTKDTAIIIAKYADVRGGVIVDPSLEGFRSWNVEDLEVVE